MTAAEAAALMLAAASLVTALGTLAAALGLRERLGRVQVAVDGHTERLVSMARTAAFAEGVLAEKASPSTVGELPTSDVVKLPTSE